MKPSLSNCTDQAPILMEFQSNLPLQWGSRKRFRPVSAISSIPLQNLSLAINGSESDGDELEGGNFPLNFKEYRFKENLKCSRNELKILKFTRFIWVFWSQPPLPSLDKCADLYPEVRDKIRDALEKLILWTDFAACLVQFWAPASTLVEPTFLRTQDQPFAFGRAHKQLCEYRVNIREDKFYVDADSKEEQLGLPGRVFRHKLPECNPTVEYYSIKEYPQRDLALRCEIMGSWAVPVFEHQTCVGVLEMVSLVTGSWLDKSFLARMDNIFKEFGLQCCDRCPNSEMHLSCKPSKYPYVNILSRQEKGLTAAFEELNRVLRSVCETHELPLAMIWVPCSACDSLQRGPLWSKDGFGRGYSSFRSFYGICRLRQGRVAQRALLSRKMLYCSDITQLSVDECPLVPYARQRKLNGWFTICLQSRETGNDIYVLEFFFSDESKDDKIIRTRLSFILGTMDEYFETFKLASGKELGEKMSIEGIYFRNDKVDYSVKSFQAIRNISGPSSVQSSPSVDSPSYSVQLLKVTRESSTSDANTRSRSQDADTVTIRAKLERAVYCIKFKLSLPCRLVELQQKVAERLKLDAETYHIYHIDKGEWIWITCDQELQTWVHNRGIP